MKSLALPALATVIVLTSPSSASVVRQLPALNEELQHMGAVHEIVGSSAMGRMWLEAELEALGPAAIPALLAMASQANGGWQVLPVVARYDSEEVDAALAMMLEAQWAQYNGQSSLLLDRLLDAVKIAEVRAAEPVLIAVMAMAEPELADIARHHDVLGQRDPFLQHPLPTAIRAADALVAVGSPAARARAVDFLLTVLDEIKPSCEVPPGVPLAIALAALVDEEEKALEWTIQIIAWGIYPPADMFARIPRTTGDRALVNVIYESLEAFPHTYCSVGVETAWAMFEALSEFDLTLKVVPREFWQSFWDRCKHDLVRPSWAAHHEPPPEVQDWMLTPRMMAFLVRMDITL
jgi:hypothetical protein